MLITMAVLIFLLVVPLAYSVKGVEKCPPSCRRYTPCKRCLEKRWRP